MSGIAAIPRIVIWLAIVLGCLSGTPARAGDVEFGAALAIGQFHGAARRVALRRAEFDAKHFFKAKRYRLPPLR